MYLKPEKEFYEKIREDIHNEYHKKEMPSYNVEQVIQENTNLSRDDVQIILISEKGYEC